MSLLEGLSLVKQGKVYDLGQEWFVGMPRYPTHPPFMFSLTRPHRPPQAERPRSAAACIFTMGGHVGTHIDALGHTGYGGQVHGHPEHIVEHQSYEHGLALAGIETTPPIMRRGVLLDIPPLYGLEVLEDHHEVTAENLAEAQARQGSPVLPGDVLLVRTGWMRHWENEALYGGPSWAPGLGDSACLWAAERGVGYVGSDTVAFGRTEKGGAVGESHVILQFRHGVQIMEVVNLEELARDKVYEFLFIALPLKIRGGTASPIRPVAVI